MLTSKQRARLRAMAQELQPVLYVGKDGVTDNIIKQADDVLEARELIKGSVQQNSSVTAKEACDALTAATGAQPVSVMGRKFVLYRESVNNKKIELK